VTTGEKRSFRSTSGTVLYFTTFFVVFIALLNAGCAGLVSGKSSTIPTPPLPSQLAIATPALAQALTGQPYAATLHSSGGTPSYTWSITSGQLLTGLSLGAASGQISGTPTVSGQVNLTLQVTDSASPRQTASRSFNLIVAATPLTDTYGGLLSVPSPKGATGFFRIEKFGTRWMLVTPAGNAFWYLGVAATGNSNVPDATGKTYTDYISAKYGGGTNALYVWASQEKKRMLSWGFNALGYDESAYMRAYGVNGNQPVNPLLPHFDGRARFGFSSINNSPAILPSPVKNIGWMEPLVSIFPDVFDPAFQTYANALMVQNTQSTTGGVPAEVQSPWVIGYALDDSDNLNGFNSFLAPHLGWMVLATAPTQTTGFVYTTKYTYTDPTVYSKISLQTFLKNRYAGSITALNNAWGSSYTSWDSAGGYGVGTGLLDENGRSHSWMGQYSTLSGETAAMQNDLNDFEVLISQRYFQVAHDAIRAVDLNHLILGPVTVSSSTRSNILLGAKPYVDAFIAGAEPFTSSTSCAVQTPASTIYDLTGKPVLAASYFIEANPDSSQSGFPAGACRWGFTMSSTQSGRGQVYQTFVGNLVNLKATDGTYPILGFHWWSLFDNQQQNFGLTSVKDNAYDGGEAVIAPGIDAWGFPTGGEILNYGDFISFARDANSTAMKTVITIH
jgi:putative Ig domain-containing protein